MSRLSKLLPLSLTESRSRWLLLLCVCLIIISNAAWFFGYKTKASDLETFRNEYPLIDVSRNYIPQEHFIVNLQPLREDIKGYLEREVPDSTFYFEFLNTGANISYNQDHPLWPASLIKVPVAMVVMRKIESGEWSLDSELVMFEEDRSTTSGELYKRAVGERFTIQALLEEMLIRSDNTAYKMFIRNLSQEEVQAIVSELGLEELTDTEFHISAKEYSRVFRSLYVSSFIKRESSQKILSLLADSTKDEYLKSGLPAEAVFPHKYAESDSRNIIGDSGIVYVPNRPYMITLVIRKADNSEEEEKKALEAMRYVSEKIYEYISNY